LPVAAGARQQNASASKTAAQWTGRVAWSKTEFMAGGVQPGMAA
jgi:hypothetical protein